VILPLGIHSGVKGHGSAVCYVTASSSSGPLFAGRFTRALTGQSRRSPAAPGASIAPRSPSCSSSQPPQPSQRPAKAITLPSRPSRRGR